jgi:hypothetical protein
MFIAKYFIENIYELVGREDRVATVSFFPDSESFKLYGYQITVMFLYTQKERLVLDESIKDKNVKSVGYAKAKYHGHKLEENCVKQLTEKGIYSEDIASIQTIFGFERNTFHSDEKRTIKTHVIKMTSKPKGRDYDWIYGFAKSLVKDGVGLSPNEKDLYLAGKYYYEPNQLTEEEKLEIFSGSDAKIKETIEREFLAIKYQREEISDDELKRYVELYFSLSDERNEILDKYLIQSGSSLKKLEAENIEFAKELKGKVLSFKDRSLNIGNKHPIYIDLDGYLHIFMRHVEEMKVNEHFAHKDNFQWNLDDVMTVIQHVVENVNPEFQDYVENNKGNQFKKYGDESIYFEGDYYAVYIAANGRLKSLFKIKKEVK